MALRKNSVLQVAPVCECMGFRCFNGLASRRFRLFIVVGIVAK